MTCDWCGEEIRPGEASDAVANGNLHHECAARSILGSVAHIEGRCGCYVKGSEAGDPPGMTLRQAAIATLVAWRAKATRDVLHELRN